MQTLELECPTCGEQLEMDAGFAGGVCRCSNCGTLMTVPSGPGEAEQLTAPPQDRNAASATNRRDLNPGRGARGRSRSKGKRKTGSDSTSVRSGTYRTATGRVINIDSNQRVPLAKGKRRTVRVATIAIFLCLIVLVVVVAAVAISTMLGTNGGETPGQAGTDPSSVNTADASAPEPTYDPQANPYAVSYPNVFGLPLQGKVAVVIESSRDSAYWTPQAADLIQAGLRKRGLPASVALFAATGGEPAAFDNGRHKPLAQINASLLRAWFGELPEARDADRSAAIESALRAKPDTLVLILSGADADEIDQWDELAADQAGLTIHAVLVDGLSRPLRDWLRERAGSEFISIQSGQFDTWKAQAQPRP